MPSVCSTTVIPDITQTAHHDGFGRCTYISRGVPCVACYEPIGWRAFVFTQPVWSSVVCLGRFRRLCDACVWSCFSCTPQLVFHPEKRITVDEALEHAYLADLHGQVQPKKLKKTTVRKFAEWQPPMYSAEVRSVGWMYCA